MQNESEVGSDILMVSNYFLYFKTWVNRIWNQALANPNNIRMYIVYYITSIKVAGFNNGIYIKYNFWNE